MRSTLLLGFLSLLAVPAAHAEDEFDACIDAGHRSDNTAAVEHCTKALESGTLSGRNRVMALVNRSIVYRNLRNFDAAIVDCTAALKLMPDNPDALFACGQGYGGKGEYEKGIASFDRGLAATPDSAWALNARGNLYNQIGDYDRAVADFESAIRQQPTFAFARLNRGIALYNAGRYPEALEALRDAAEADSGNAYAVLWRALAERRAGQPIGVDLMTGAMMLDLDQWPGPIVRQFRKSAPFMLGDDERKDTGGLDLEPTGDQDCESAFYYGEWALLDGDKDRAKSQLAHAAETCPKTFIEHAGALAELKRM